MMLGSLLASLCVVFSTSGVPVFATFDQDQLATSVDHANSAYTQALYGVQAEFYRTHLSDLSYSNGVVRGATGSPVDAGRDDTVLEASRIVLRTYPSSWGVGLAVTDEGDLVTYLEDQSPRPPGAVIDARRQAALQERKQLHKNLRDLRGAATTNATLIAASAPAPGANATAVRASLIQLQKTVAELQRQNEDLTKALLKSMNGKAK